MKPHRYSFSSRPSHALSGWAMVLSGSTHKSASQEGHLYRFSHFTQFICVPNTQTHRCTDRARLHATSIANGHIYRN